MTVNFVTNDMSSIERNLKILTLNKYITLTNNNRGDCNTGATLTQVILTNNNRGDRNPEATLTQVILTDNNGGDCSTEATERSAEGECFSNTDSSRGEDSLEVCLPWDSSEDQHNGVINLGRVGKF